MDRSRSTAPSSDLGNAGWEMVRHEPGQRLRTQVCRSVGFTERVARPVRRRELPSGETVLVVSFGAPFGLIDPARPGLVTEPRAGFVAGLSNSYTLSESRGEVRCVQVNLTPLGLYQLLGRPMSDVANRVVGLDDLFGSAGRELPERLADAPDWATRFEIVDDFIAARLAQARPPAPGVVWAWRRIEEAAGSIGIGALAADLGWSPRHLIAQFREQIGLPPKLLARILRFQRAVGRLDGADDARWADIAYDCGYYDQAHLIRDFHEFAGCAPGELLGRRIPAGGGVLDG